MAAPVLPVDTQPILDALPLGVWVARAPGGEFIYANGMFAEIMGTRARDDVAVGEYAAPYGICDRDGNPYPEERLPFVQALLTKTTVMIDDIVIHRPDGRRVCVRTIGRPVMDGDRVDHVVVAFFDITLEVEADVARRSSDAQLSATRRMQSLGALASGVAHDFNNVLTVIQMLAERLAAGETDPERLTSFRLIEEATTRAGALTRSLLQFAARTEAPWATIKINDVVSGLRELMVHTLEGIELELGLEASDGGAISGDRVQLEQLLVNLAINARDAMSTHGGGKLILATRDVQLASGPGVLLEVVDDGPGIPEALRDRVLEPFFTTKRASAGDGASRGIGLAIVQGIVERHGGALAILEAPSGRGTAVEVRLPAATLAGAPLSR